MFRSLSAFLRSTQKIDLTDLETFLKSDFLQIADIGATGGPEQKWKNIRKVCHFYTFDPDPRADVATFSSTNYPIGAWSKKCQKELNLSLSPPSSSLYPINYKIISQFLNASSHQIVGKETIELDTIDNKVPQADFIKIDAEGAELEILKGATRVLENTLGLQLEVSFCERHNQAPFFSDLDNFLQKHNFQLVILNREHWIRKNNLFCLHSFPQLIWGNAVYLVSLDVFLERLQNSDNKASLASKYLLILLSYGLYDYADDLCSRLHGVLEDAVIRKFIKTIRKSMPSNTLCVAKLLVSLFIGIGGVVLLLPSKKMRIKAIWFLKDRLRYAAFLLSNFARHGEPHSFAISDYEG